MNNCVAAAELSVTAPQLFESELRYIINIIATRLSLRLTFAFEPECSIISISSKDGRRLRLNSDFFDAVRIHGWLSKMTLPCSKKRKSWQSSRLQGDINCSLPVVYGTSEGEFVDRVSEKEFSLRVDIFGTAFVLLSRYEEYFSRETDRHGRFRLVDSIAYNHGFYDRPLVDNYIERFARVVEYIWPEIKCRKTKYSVRISHDVDFPFIAHDWPIIALAKDITRNLLRGESRHRSWERIACKIWRHWSLDPAYNFDYLMRTSEAFGLCSNFYFLSGRRRHSLDSYYHFTDSVITQLIAEIVSRGHIVGFHGSYKAYESKDRIAEEFSELREILNQFGDQSGSIGGRQHYLRWRVGKTWEAWDAAGLKYDSSLGFAEHAGFRCSTCHEYPTYNLLERKPMYLFERPLVAMDVTLQAKCYMGLSEHQILACVRGLRSRIEEVGGCFELLWHNTEVCFPEQKMLYENVLDAICL